MQNRVGWLMTTLVVAVGVGALATGCGSSGSGEGSSVSVSLEDLPDAPRRTVQRLKKDAFGQVSYEITGTRNGRSAEGTFDPSGKLLET